MQLHRWRDAHRFGPKYDEAKKLTWPPKRYSLHDLCWRGVRAGLLSTGIALGLRTGFDSGSTLDYIYRNEAQGRTKLGRLIDRNYLNAAGWRGIRVRGAHMQQ